MGLPGMGGGGMGFGGGVQAGAFEGVGQRLRPEGDPRADESPHQNRPARELAGRFNVTSQASC